VSSHDCHRFQVHTGPAQASYFGAANTGGHDQPNERSPVLAQLESAIDQARGVGRRRWVRLGLLLLGTLRDFGGVCVDPLPADGGVKRAADDGVNLADGRGGHRLAFVGLAVSFHAVVFVIGGVLNEGAAVAPGATAAQQCVKRFEIASAQLVHGGAAKYGANDALDVANIAVSGARLDVGCA
jgi:hypothetical protein